MLKNIPQNEALLLTELIPYQAGQVVSRTLSRESPRERNAVRL